MTPILRYGRDAAIALEPGGSTLVGFCGAPKLPPVDDLRAEVRRALGEPLDYPPFSSIVTPSDRVVVALAEEVPGAAQIVGVVVDGLVESRVDPEAITVLRPASLAGDDPCRLLDESVRSRVRSLSHVPGQRDDLAYLAATQHGETVFLNRALVDADLVLPIGCFRGALTDGHHGIFTSIYPTFSDDQTLRRFRSTTTLDARGRHRKRLAREADEVGWLLGVAFTIQVFPAAGDGIHRVLAGKVDRVAHRGMELYTEHWRHHVASPANVVLAALEGNAAHQTWRNLGRALEAALPLVEPGGGLALCTELAEAPGAAVACLRAVRSRADAVRRIHDDEPADAVTALQLARALDHCSVYLLSRLEDDLVEDLDMTPVAEPAELVRLANRSGSFLLLGNASYAHVTVEGDTDD
ncbi:MAG: DUF2088 domain-containing protein [Pirellulales bacterium]|nr:DUF2088 domain-containing protein [Pirellulales bacterium]